MDNIKLTFYQLHRVKALDDLHAFKLFSLYANLAKGFIVALSEPALTKLFERCDDAVVDAQICCASISALH